MIKRLQRVEMMKKEEEEEKKNNRSRFYKARENRRSTYTTVIDELNWSQSYERNSVLKKLVLISLLGV